MTGAPTELPLVVRARQFANRTATITPEGTFSYSDLLSASGRVARTLLRGDSDLQEARVAYLVPPGFHYVAVQWGVWRAGGVAVPLATSHPPKELSYVLDDARPTSVVAHPEMLARIAPAVRERNLPLLRSDELVEGAPMEAGIGPPKVVDALPALPPGRRAMMLYTSGTTGRPKGVVTTHGNLQAQVTALEEAWGWNSDDHILLVLPLHHVHGIVNVLTCALWSGARCQILPGFDPLETWRRIAVGDLTLFMAVPTIYSKLLRTWEAQPKDVRVRWTNGCRRMRLMVSGSAALPVSMLERWRNVTDHTLLERYGMTEIGMALSNSLDGTRRPGFVGRPLPGVEVRLVDEDEREAPPGTPGEIHVRGPGVFLEYWERPSETEEAFHEGWFRTGDIAVVEDGDYRILGRRSVDIIKSGGYKVSALEVEEVLRGHPSVSECAVVAVPDPEWGERVGVALVPSNSGTSDIGPASQVDPVQLRGWAKERLAPYKVPTAFLIVSELPRNAMGKVTKPDVARLFQRKDAPVKVL